MIEKLETTVRGFDDTPSMPTATDFLNKINELVDAINAIQKEREAEWFEIREWISIIEAVRKAVNKLETMAKNTNTVLKSLVETKHEEPVDPFAEQRKWIGCLCRFWFDNKKLADIGILGDINEYGTHLYFNADLGCNYKCCEPVKPDDDIIYKGK